MPHVVRNCLIIILSAILLAACGPRGGRGVPTATRAFPGTEVPSVYGAPQERVGWTVEHFWDRFTDTTRAYPCDSVTVNGVALTEVESQMGTFSTLLREVPQETGVRAVAHFYDRVDAFARKYPETNVFEQLCHLTRYYLYDPNSPVRNEDLYQPFVARLSTSDLVDSGYRKGYAWDAKMCSLNRVGTPAADFAFTDTEGRVRTLYGIRAEYLLLVFGNPGCQACRELMDAMSSTPQIAALTDSGRLQVVDIYIDQDIDDWRAHIPDYPAAWINGYDHGYIIRTDLLYNVRGIPSLYLLDASKTVLMKDAVENDVLTALMNL